MIVEDGASHYSLVNSLNGLNWTDFSILPLSELGRPQDLKLQNQHFLPEPFGGNGNRQKATRALSLSAGSSAYTTPSPTSEETFVFPKYDRPIHHAPTLPSSSRFSTSRGTLAATQGKKLMSLRPANGLTSPSQSQFMNYRTPSPNSSHREPHHYCAMPHGIVPCYENPNVDLDNYGLPCPEYSRKLFVGGLPEDAPPDYIEKVFEQFGSVTIDWPKAPTHFKEGKRFPMSRPKLTGYVFLVYKDESSVHKLVSSCIRDNGELFLILNGPHIRDKPAHVRPWRLSGIDYMKNPTVEFDLHRAVFIGGVPRTTTAQDLAQIMERSFGPVLYAGIDVDPELKYPKGAARVVFATDWGYIRAITGRFVKVPNADGHRKEVEVKPYVLDEIHCDECRSGDGSAFAANTAIFFCGEATCLQYYCKDCWQVVHNCRRGTRSAHIPLVKVDEMTKLLSDVLHSNNGDLVQRYLRMTA